MQNSERMIGQPQRQFTGWLLAGCVTLACCADSVVAADPKTAVRAEAAKPNSVEQRVAIAIAAGRQKNAESVYDLTALLCDDNSTIRSAAAWACTQLGEAAAPALPQLTEGLSDLESRVRVGCATAIGQLGHRGSVAEAALVRATQDRSPDVRCAALIALRAVGVRQLEPAMEAIGRAMRASDPQVQCESIATANSLLNQCGHALKQSLATCLFPALTSQNDEVRLAATVLAGDLEIDAASAISAIVNNADDLDESIQMAAHQALLRFAESVDQQWNRLDPDERELLRRPGHLAAKGLSGYKATSSDVVKFATRFQKLVAGVELASAEQVVADEIDSPESDDLPVTERADNSEPQRLSEIAVSAAEKSAWSSAWMWLIGIAVVITAIGLVRLGLKKDELPIFIPAKPDDLAMTDFAVHLHDQDHLPAVTTAATPVSIPPVKATNSPTEIQPKSVTQQKQTPLPAHTGLIDSLVLPAVLASVPGGELPDDVAGEATSPATSPAPTDLSARREATNRLADSGLATTAQLTRGMRDSDAVVRWRSASAVGAVHAATLQPLLDAVGSPDVDVRRVAATSIRGFGQEVVPAFTNALKDQSAEVREAAATALGRIGRGAVEALVPLALSLKDSEPQVRAAAAMSLATLGPNAGRASGNLQQVLTDHSPAVRARAAFALGKIGPIAKGTVPDLIRLLSDPDPSVRRAAATGLGGIGQDAKPAVPALQQSLKDPDVGVRRCAVTTLGILAPNESVEALQTALTDADSQVRTFAQSAMQKVSKTNRTVPLNRAV